MRKKIRCEADYKDGGVCLARHYEDEECPDKKNHA